MKFNIKTLCSVGALLLCSENLFAMTEPYAVITDNISWRSSEVSLSKLKEKSKEELSSIIEMRIVCDEESSNKDLPSVLKILKNMGNLKYLILRRTCLTEFPSEILGCQKLAILNISDNNIQNIPPEIRYLTNLKELDVSDNKIRDIPSEISNLQNLQLLNIKNNRMKEALNNSSLLDVIGDISSLRYIEYGYNVMDSIYRFLKPVFNPIPAMRHLEPVLGFYRPKGGRMDLSEKNLSRVPLDILSLDGVKVLDLSNNNIKKIPLCLKNMSELKEIILCGNPYFDSFDKIDDELLEVDLLKFVISAGNEQVSKTAKEIKKERIDQLTTELNALQIRLDKLNSITPIKSLKTEGRYRLSN